MTVGGRKHRADTHDAEIGKTLVARGQARAPPGVLPLVQGAGFQSGEVQLWVGRRIKMPRHQGCCRRHCNVSVRGLWRWVFRKRGVRQARANSVKQYRMAN